MNLPSVLFRRDAIIDGNSYQNEFTVTGNGDVEVTSVVNPGKTGGTLSTRTNNTQGIITFPAGHGFITGDVLDIYWLDNGVYGSRRGVTLTVAANDCTITGGSGDNLPTINNNTIVGIKPVTVDFVVTGDNVVALVFASPVPAWGVFTLANGTTVVTARRTTVLAKADTWNNVDGGVNPMAASAVAKIKLSHGEVTAQVLSATAIYN